MWLKFETNRSQLPQEFPFLNFFKTLAFLFLANFAVLIVVALVVPETAREVTGRDIAENVFSAKNACISSSDQHTALEQFCQEVFEISRQGMFLKERTEVPDVALTIFRNKNHILYRYLRLDANAYELFGDAQDLLLNRIAAYSHAECAVSAGQMAGIVGFKSIRWSFERSIRQKCRSYANSNLR